MAVVIVDLSEPELRRKRDRRFDILASLADELYIGSQRLLNPAEVSCDYGELARAVEASFLLGEAYKVERANLTFRDAVRAKNPRKVALTALGVFLFRPFRLVDGAREPVNTISPLANLQFVLDFATTVLGRDFSNYTRDMQQRLFRFLSATAVDCLGEYRHDQLQGVQRSRYPIDIETDLPVIELLILLFELHGSGDENAEDD